MTRGALGRSLALPKEGGSAKKPLPSLPKKPYNYNVLVADKISKNFVARSHSAPPLHGLIIRHKALDCSECKQACNEHDICGRAV